MTLEGLAPRAAPRRHLRVLQVALPEAQRHRPGQPQLNHHPASAQARVDRLADLIDAVLEAHRVVVADDTLALHAQDRGQVVARTPRAVGIGGLR